MFLAQYTFGKVGCRDEGDQFQSKSDKFTDVSDCKCLGVAIRHFSDSKHTFLGLVELEGGNVRSTVQSFLEKVQS